MEYKRRLGLVGGGLLAIVLSFKGLLAVADNNIEYQQVPEAKQCYNIKNELAELLASLHRKNPQTTLDRYIQDEEFRKKYDLLSTEYRKLSEKKEISEAMNKIERSHWYSGGLGFLFGLGLGLVGFGIVPNISKRKN